MSNLGEKKIVRKPYVREEEQFILDRFLELRREMYNSTEKEIWETVTREANERFHDGEPLRKMTTVREKYYDLKHNGQRFKGVMPVFMEKTPEMTSEMETINQLMGLLKKGIIDKDTASRSFDRLIEDL